MCLKSAFFYAIIGEESSKMIITAEVDMSYNISIPIMNANVMRQGSAEILRSLREMDAQRVFLALDCYVTDPEEQRASLEELRDNCTFFHNEGFEVGAWIWAFMFKGDAPFTPMTLVHREPVTQSNHACPFDPDFLKFSGEYIQRIAECGVDLIMFDDDLRFGFLKNGLCGCICEHHRRRICEILGEELSAEELAVRILTGGRNPARDAWIQANGESLERFAAHARSCVDRVDAHIRLGACCCMTNWDIDGTDAMRLAKILAGNTKPFARLIGAPYWAVRQNWGNILQDVVELERMESSYMEREGIELMAEGDAYPRPRITCPASYLEGFDTAIRASGATDGILKYGIDYTSTAIYERGYVEYHKRNRPRYRQIDDFFDGRTACGIRVYEPMKKAADAEMEDIDQAPRQLQYLFFSNAARLLAAQAIPTTYEGRGVCGIAFGEAVRSLDAEARRGGMIIDGSGALILHRMGIDVGIREVGKQCSSVVERFANSNEWIATHGATVYAHRFSEKIRVLSVAAQSGGSALMGANEGMEDTPLLYTYENAEGERYLVLNYNGRIASKDASDLYFRGHYMRGRMIADSIEWLSRGRRLPSYCYGNPYLYSIAKENEAGLAVGLWNFHADPVWNGVVELGEEYRDVRFTEGTTGVLRGDRLCIDEIPAHGFCAFVLEK